WSRPRGSTTAFSTCCPTPCRSRPASCTRGPGSTRPSSAGMRSTAGGTSASWASTTAPNSICSATSASAHPSCAMPPTRSAQHSWCGSPGSPGSWAGTPPTAPDPIAWAAPTPACAANWPAWASRVRHTRAPWPTHKPSPAAAPTWPPRSARYSRPMPPCASARLPRQRPTATCSAGSSSPYHASRHGGAATGTAPSNCVLSGFPERDVRPPLQRQLQIDPGRSQKNQRPRMIHSEMIMRPPPKLLQPLPIARNHPPRRVHIHRLEHALHSILILQAERHHLELQLPHRSQDEVIVAHRLEQLRRSLLAQLRQPFLQCLHLQWILEHRAPENLRREVGHPREGQLLPLGERVADVDRAVVVEADDVAGVGLLRMLPLRRHEGQRIRHPHFLAEPRMIEPHAARVLARAQPQERDAVAMPRVHVGLDLEHEPRQRLLQRRHQPLARLARPGARCVRGEGREELLHAEVADGRAEEDWRLPAGKVGLRIEHRGGTADQLDLLDDGIHAVPQKLAGRIAREPLDHLVLTDPAALAREIDVNAILRQVIDAAQIPPHADRPGDRSRGDAEHLLDLVEQLDGRPPLAIELVDESHD